MYELVQISKNDYYIDCPAKIGIVKISQNEVVAIDSGSDKDSAKKILRHLEENGWELKKVFLTHSHADHVGGNKLLQERTGCKSYAHGIDAMFPNFPILEPVSLYGGFPFNELKNKFLMAQESNVELLTPEVLPEGFEIIDLPGHSFSQIGIKTPDGNVFLADSLIAEQTLSKYGISYLWDVEAYLTTLEKIQTIKAEKFIPAHAAVTEDICDLAKKNLQSVNEVIEKIKQILQTPMPFDVLLQKIFNEYGLVMNAQQNVLIGSTVRSYLSYLKNQNVIEYVFENNLMLWKTK